MSQPHEYRLQYFEQILSRYIECGGDRFIHYCLNATLPSIEPKNMAFMEHAVRSYLCYLVVYHADDKSSPLRKHFVWFPKKPRSKMQCGKLSLLYLRKLSEDGSGIFVSCFWTEDLSQLWKRSRGSAHFPRKELLLAVCQIINDFAHFVESWSGVPDEALDQALIAEEWNPATVRRRLPPHIRASLDCPIGVVK